MSQSNNPIDSISDLIDRVNDYKKLKETAAYAVLNKAIWVTGKNELLGLATGGVTAAVLASTTVMSGQFSFSDGLAVLAFFGVFRCYGLCVQFFLECGQWDVKRHGHRLFLQQKCC